MAQAGGSQQGEEDRAPYCTPAYVSMQAGASRVLLRHARTAIPILEKSRAEWLDRSQVRDYALCVARLAAACTDAGQLEQACAAASDGAVGDYRQLFTCEVVVDPKTHRSISCR